MRSTRPAMTLILLLLLFFGLLTVHAATGSFSGALNGSSPTFTRPDSSVACNVQPSLTGTNVFYSVQSFEVSTAGAYTISIVGSEPLFVYLYANAFNPASPNANCIADASNSASLRPTASLIPNVTYFLVSTTAFNTTAATFTSTISGPGEINSSPGSAGESFLDGRINRFDFAAPFAVYPHHVNGSVGMIIYDSYAPDDAPLELLLISAAQIADVPEFPETNTRIASSADGRVAVYRLTDGTFQVQGPTYNAKDYVLQFAVIQSGVAYTSVEVD